MAMPVSRTSVFEKKDTSTPVTKPIVSSQNLHFLLSHTPIATN